MNPNKLGTNISRCRRQANLTQEALGERLGVTNKTISRWETGRYLPDIIMLQLLARELHVDIQALLTDETDGDPSSKPNESKQGVPEKAGDRESQNAEAYDADRSLDSVFPFAERREYFKQKWRREHRARYALLLLVCLAALILPFVFNKPYLACAMPLLAGILYAYLHNQMMIYVEHHLYDG